LKINYLVVNPNKSKGYSLISLLVFLVIASIFIGILAPRIGYLRFNLFTYVDSTTSNGIATAIYALNKDNKGNNLTIEDVECSNLYIFNPKPYTPGAEEFKIVLKESDFSIIIVDKNGIQVGDVLFPPDYKK
jgi:competence protein ComGC